MPPKDALRMIETALDEGATPHSQWVESAMVPSRLARRKEVFLSLLADCFGMRGRQWLPMDDKEESDEPVDSAQAPVLTPLHAPGLFCVVDRIGSGDNLEEHWFDDPWTVG